MRLHLCSLLAVFTCAVGCTAWAQTAPPLPAKPEFHLFLLAGQSNMAGRGKVDAAGKQPHERVLVLGRESQWKPAKDPLHWDKGAAGAGLGKPFAEIVAAKNPKITVGLIPTACGGSPISTWMPGQEWKQTNSHPWDDCIARAKQAMQDGTLKAILWHQGEADPNPRAAAEYEKKLEDLITRLRAELQDPDVPFIIGQLGRFPAKPWGPPREAVDAAHQAVAKRVKNVRFVTAEGLTSIGDDLHFDTASLRIFGERYADAYFSLTSQAVR